MGCNFFLEQYSSKKDFGARENAHPVSNCMVAFLPSIFNITFISRVHTEFKSKQYKLLKSSVSAGLALNDAASFDFTA